MLRKHRPDIRKKLFSGEYMWSLLLCVIKLFFVQPILKYESSFYLRPFRASHSLIWVVHVLVAQYSISFRFTSFKRFLEISETSKPVASSCLILPCLYPRGYLDQSTQSLLIPLLARFFDQSINLGFWSSFNKQTDFAIQKANNNGVYIW